MSEALQYVKNKIKIKIEEKRKQILDLKIEIEKIVKEAMPNFSFEHVIGYWDCDESPIGICMYNKFEDPAMDECF